MSERDGFWDLFVAAMEDSMPVFAQFDCLKYLRYGALFLEVARTLEYSHPEIYRRCAMGQWVVQETSGWHKAVGGDMKVEQTIQRDSKGPGGHHVVGETRKAQSCADYELLYHEIANIGVLLNEITRTTNTRSESYLPHSLNQNRQYNFNGQVI